MKTLSSFHGFAKEIGVERYHVVTTAQMNAVVHMNKSVKTLCDVHVYPECIAREIRSREVLCEDCQRRAVLVSGDGEGYGSSYE